MFSKRQSQRQPTVDTWHSPFVRINWNHRHMQNGRANTRSKFHAQCNVKTKTASVWCEGGWEMRSTCESRKCKCKKWSCFSFDVLVAPENPKKNANRKTNRKIIESTIRRDEGAYELGPWSACSPRSAVVAVGSKSMIPSSAFPFNICQMVDNYDVCTFPRGLPTSLLSLSAPFTSFFYRHFFACRRFVFGIVVRRPHCRPCAPRTFVRTILWL